MPEEFEGQDLSGAVFWGVDLTGARFRDVRLADVKISHALVSDLDIDARIDRITINGVDVTEYVNERDRWYPLRAMLRPSDPDGMRAAWAALEQAWSTTVERARQLPEDRLHESVNGEWSFVETLRHLVFAMDKWFSMPILGDDAMHPIGMSNSGSVDFGWPGIDRSANPTFTEALAARAGRADRMRDYLVDVTSADLRREVEVLENGINPVDECLFTVFEEEFEHHRYALRDLAQLT